MKKQIFKLVILVMFLLLIIPAGKVFSQEQGPYSYPEEGDRPYMQGRSYSYEGNNLDYKDLTIREFLLEIDDFSILAGAVKAAGLEDALAEKGPLTIFAPRNIAFRRLRSEAADYLLTCSAGKLETFLKNHLVTGMVKSDSLISGEQLTSITGKKLSIGRRWFNPVVGGATVSGNAVVLKNGLLYSVDSVIPDEEMYEMEQAAKESPAERPETGSSMVPEYRGMAGRGGIYYPWAEGMNVMEVLSQRDELSIFFGAIKASGLDSEISQTEGITVFAPVNSAFSKLPSEQAEYLMTCDKGELIKILRNHLLQGTHYEVDLMDKNSVTNLDGDELRLAKDWFSISIGGASLRGYEITATNGVIHMIDQVILPNDLK